MTSKLSRLAAAALMMAALARRARGRRALVSRRAASVRWTKLSAPPSEIQIKFDAPIEKLFAKLQAIRVDGKDYAVGESLISDDGIELSSKLATLKPGEYTVKWAVVSRYSSHPGLLLIHRNRWWRT